MGKFVYTQGFHDGRWWFSFGFGSRYAGGCTSGLISGLSNLQMPSLVRHVVSS
jgi:hypothetical protein